MKLLKRYWFRFEKLGKPSPLNLGCGITAYDLADAREMLREKVFQTYDEQPVEEIIEDVDVSTLEEKHVRSNMGNPAVRGVWFPVL